MKSVVASALLAGSAAAFAPVSNGSARTTTSLNAELNGWVPDESKFAWGLPGSIGPVENFDPLGFADGATLGLMKRWREAEVHHGRVGA